MVVSGIDIRDTQSKEVSAHADFSGWLETYYKVSPNPKDAGSVSPDPLGTGSVSPDPLGAGSVSSDLEAAGFVSLDPLRVGSV